MAVQQYIETLSENFKRGIPTQAVPAIDINSEIIQQISKKLQLSFIDQENMQRMGEVCFANSPEIRPEFRTTFTSKDAFDYAYAVLYSKKSHEQFEKHLKTDLKTIPIPPDIFIFCKLAILGNELQKIHRMDNPTLQLNAATVKAEKVIEEIGIVLGA